MSATPPSDSLYTPLAEIDEIRLLHLEPNSSLDGNLMTCTLHHAKLSNKPRYEALSYMWGPKEMKSIQLNGQRYNVRENLWQALFHLQETNTKRVLWIDAVCINQDDIEERNYQVSQMGMIYHKAWRVLSWLGPDNDPTIELGIWALNNHVRFLSQPITDDWVCKLKAVKILCFRPYWTRLWIIQEVLGARKNKWPWQRRLLVFCGRRSFDIRSLYSLSRVTVSNAGVHDPHVISQAKATIREIYTSFASILSRAFEPAKQIKGAPLRDLPLMWLIATYGASKCENPRDKIFGVRSLAMNCCQKATKVDYAMSIRGLYEVLVEHYVAAHFLLGSWYEVPKVFQRVHLFLGITLEDISNNFTTSTFPDRLGDLDSDPSEELPFFPTGKVRGGIKYIHQAPLEGQERGNSNHAKDWSLEAIEQQLEYIQTQSTTTGRPWLSTETDLVQSFSSKRGAYATIHRSRLDNGREEGQQRALSSMKERLYISRPHDQIEPKHPTPPFSNQLELLRTSISPLPEHCRIAIDSTGLLILVPASSSVGDLICQFKDSNIILIIRPRPDCKPIRHTRMLLSPRSRPKCDLIGRAVSLVPCSRYRPAEIPGRTIDLFRGNNQGETDDTVCLSLDTRTLQLLTAFSKTPDIIAP